MEFSAEYVRELFHYDPETGIFTRKLATSNNGKVGDRVGSKTKAGYLLGSVKGKRYYMHRLAWLYVNGEWPQGVIDHIDGNPENNAIGNLREATQSQNLANMRRSSLNASGFKGVSRHVAARKWQAQIHKDNEVIPLGLYDTPELAHQAYVAAAKEMFGEFANSG